jgi:hypothetical protein
LNQIAAQMESEGKKACKIEQTCHTDLHMLLEHKLKKKIPLQKIDIC